VTAPPPKKLLRLTRSMSRYDFAKEPLFGADIVIDKSGRICKHRTGKAGDNATAEQLAAAAKTPPNR
jgi:hypothetical protein